MPIHSYAIRTRAYGVCCALCRARRWRGAEGWGSSQTMPANWWQARKGAGRRPQPMPSGAQGGARDTPTSPCCLLALLGHPGRRPVGQTAARHRQTAARHRQTATRPRRQRRANPASQTWGSQKNRAMPRSGQPASGQIAPHPRPCPCPCLVLAARKRFAAMVGSRPGSLVRQGKEQTAPIQCALLFIHVRNCVPERQGATDREQARGVHAGREREREGPAAREHAALSCRRVSHMSTPAHDPTTPGNLAPHGGPTLTMRLAV